MESKHPGREPHQDSLIEQSKPSSIFFFRNNDNDNKKLDCFLKGNTSFLRKIPSGAEASNVLVGEVDILEKPVSAFIRLSNAFILGDLTEVPVPTRFIFILLGPVVSLY